MSATLGDLLEERTWQAEGIQTHDKWVWVKSDQGAWDGPRTDWNNYHRHKYFTHVKDFDTIVTAGANLGLYVRQYAAMFKHVYAFEPDWLNFYCMSINTPYQNVYKFQAALGETPGFCSLNNLCPDNRGCFTTSPNENSDVLMMTIDQLELKKCDMIQLDVEGFEFEVLKGAVKTIKRFSPVIVVERYTSTIEGLLRPLGYEGVENSVADTVLARIKDKE